MSIPFGGLYTVTTVAGRIVAIGNALSSGSPKFDGGDMSASLK
jgi:hypothetical protein